MKTRQRPGGGRCSIGGGRRTLGRRAIFPESSRLANGTRRRESPVTLTVLLGGRCASSNRFDGIGRPYFEEASATVLGPADTAQQAAPVSSLLSHPPELQLALRFL